MRGRSQIVNRLSLVLRPKKKPDPCSTFFLNLVIVLYPRQPEQGLQLPAYPRAKAHVQSSGSLKSIDIHRYS